MEGHGLGLQASYTDSPVPEAAVLYWPGPRGSDQQHQGAGHQPAGGMGQQMVSISVTVWV